MRKVSLMCAVLSTAWVVVASCSSGNSSSDVDDAIEAVEDQAIAEDTSESSLESEEQGPEDVFSETPEELDAVDVQGPDTPACDALDRTPTVSLCSEGFSSCVPIDAIERPYLRGSVRLRASVACMPTPETALSIVAAGAPKTCTGEATCDLEIDALPPHTENTLVEAHARWDDGFEGSWSRVLPVFDCVIPAERTFCLKFGDWYEQTLPDFEDSRIAMFDALVTSKGRLHLVGISRSPGGDGWPLDRVIHRVWNLTDWSGPYFPDVTYPPMTRIDLVERPDGPVEALAQVAQTDVPDMAVMDFGNPPAVTVVMPKADLVDCMNDAVADAAGEATRKVVSDASIAYGLSGTSRYAILDGSGLGNLVLVSDENGTWACQPLAPLLVDTVPAVFDLHWPGLSDQDAVTGMDGTLHVVFESDAGIPVMATKKDGEAWTFLALPKTGTTPPLPSDPLPPGSLQGIGTGSLVRLGADGETNVFRFPSEYPMPSGGPGVVRYRVAVGSILSNEDLTETWAQTCSATPLPGSIAGPPDPLEDCRSVAQDVAIDACGRVHGVHLAGLDTWAQDKPGWIALPVSTFDNLSGSWSSEPVPELGVVAAGAPQGLRLLIDPEGALHLFAIGNPVPPPSTSPEDWNAGFRLRHWIRPCEVPFVE